MVALGAEGQEQGHYSHGEGQRARFPAVVYPTVHHGGHHEVGEEKPGNPDAEATAASTDEKSRYRQQLDDAYLDFGTPPQAQPPQGRDPRLVVKEIGDSGATAHDYENHGEEKGNNVHV